MKEASSLLAACEIGLACCIAWGGKCEAQGETILALQAVMHAESIRFAIAQHKKQMIDDAQMETKIGELAAEVVKLEHVIQAACDRLEPMRADVTPSVLRIRSVVELLQRAMKQN